MPTLFKGTFVLWHSKLSLISIILFYCTLAPISNSSVNSTSLSVTSMNWWSKLPKLPLKSHVYSHPFPHNYDLIPPFPPLHSITLISFPPFPLTIPTHIETIHIAIESEEGNLNMFDTQSERCVHIQRFFHFKKNLNIKP